MPTILWSVDGQEVRLTDRGNLGIRIACGSEPPIAIPPRTLGEWPLPLAQRQAVLRTVRNLDVVRFQLWSDGHLIPRTVTHLAPAPAPPGSTCGAHSATPATVQCLRCGTFVCRTCAPDGTHCAPCLDRRQVEEQQAALRARRIGLGGSVALGFGLALVGRLGGWPRMAALGLSTVFLVGFLWVRGLVAERRDRRAGRGVALPR